MTGPSTPSFHVVLVEPAIPQNTGTIGRLCVAAGARLHLVGPLGFALDDRRRRRAGLDYWPHLDYRVYDDLARFLGEADPSPERSWYAVARAGRPYTDAAYRAGDWLFFGTETEGLPPDLHADRPDRRVSIPMRPEARSINLSIATGIVLYEGLRRTGWRTAEGGPDPGAPGASFS